MQAMQSFHGGQYCEKKRWQCVVGQCVSPPKFFDLHDSTARSHELTAITVRSSGSSATFTVHLHATREINLRQVPGSFLTVMS